MSTPGSFVSLVGGSAGAYGPEWTPAGLPRWVRHLVVDEADLLLTGSYIKELKKVLEVRARSAHDHIFAVGNELCTWLNDRDYC